MSNVIASKIIILSYNLYPEGKITFAYDKTYEQVSGVSKIIAKIDSPDYREKYPDCWFPVSYKTIVSIKNTFSSESGENFKHFIPTQILLDFHSYQRDILKSKQKYLS